MSDPVVIVVPSFALSQARHGREVTLPARSYAQAKGFGEWFRRHDDLFEWIDLDRAVWRFLHPSGGSITIELPAISRPAP